MTVLGVVDLETTGLSFEKGHRIIEICMAKLDLSQRPLKVDWWESRVNPRRSIPQDSMAIHKITDEDLINEPYLEDVADDFLRFTKNVDLLVAHNLMFDAPFLLDELSRVRRPFPELQGFCTMENGRWATASGKLPNLQELCFACEVEYEPEKAHAARYDVAKTLECLLRGIKEKTFIIEGVNDGNNT